MKIKFCNTEKLNYRLKEQLFLEQLKNMHIIKLSSFNLKIWLSKVERYSAPFLIKEVAKI